MPGEKPCEVLLLYRKRSPGKRLFAPRPFLLSYTIPPLRHFLRVRRPSAKKALQSGAKACIINASNMLTERVRARFCPPAERGAAGCKRPGMVSRRSSLTSGFAEGCGCSRYRTTECLLLYNRTAKTWVVPRSLRTGKLRPCQSAGAGLFLFPLRPAKHTKERTV